MTCARCQNEVDGSDYPHWQKVCWPCKATLDAREDAAKLEKENRELRTKQQLSPSSNWAIEDSRSIAEIENDELRAELAAAKERAEKAEAENAALRAHVERMRKAFKRIITTDENGNSMTWPQIDEMVRPLLAATPAQSLAKCKAETLMEAATNISTAAQQAEASALYASGSYGWEDAVDWLTSEAERLQEEMRKDGKDG